MAVDLSIIIVNWRSLPYLRACISSIHRTTSGVSYEIIVVDNNSGDDSDKLISKEFPHVILISSPENLGFARANNLGYARSSGGIILFLNPDTELLDNALARMVQHLRLEESVGAIGPRLLNSDGSLQTSCVQAFPTVWNQFLDSEFLQRTFPVWDMWGMGSLFDVTQKPSDVEGICGACFMVKRNVLEQVGLLTEAYFMYVEDIDLSYKIAKAGYRVQCLPACAVIHHGGKSSSLHRPGFANLWQKESYCDFFRYRRGQSYATLYRITQAGSAIGRMLLLVFIIVAGVPRSRTDGCAALTKWWSTFQWAIGLKRLKRGTKSGQQNRYDLTPKATGMAASKVSSQNRFQ